MELNLGALVTFKNAKGVTLRLQNYKLAESVVYSGQSFSFAPFSFAGAVASLQGDNIEATLVFAANAITRSWGEQAMVEGWIGVVQVMMLDDNSSISRMLYSYTGEISTGGFDQVNLELQLNTIVDAVKGSIPGRPMNRQLLGNIPVTANISVR